MQSQYSNRIQAEQVVARQPAISLPDPSQYPFNRAGGRTSTFAVKIKAILVATVAFAFVAIGGFWGFHLYSIHSKFGTEGLLKRHSSSKGIFRTEVASLAPCSIDFEDSDGKRSVDSRWVFIDWCHRASITTSYNYDGEDVRNEWRRGSFSYGSIVDLVSGDKKKTIRYQAKRIN